MIERIIIHIGAHKTGSTYLQARLCESRQSLLQEGILYPHNWQTLMWGHHALIQEIEQGKIESPEQIWQQLASEASSDTNTIILSSENFETASEKVIALLAQAIPQHIDKQIVFFVRKWSGLLPSLWQEVVKHGSTLEYPYFVLQHLISPYNSNRLNSQKICHLFAKFFSRQSLKIVFYDYLYEQQEDLFDFFLNKFCGISQKIAGDFQGKILNKSFDPRDIEIIRALNILDLKMARPLKQEIRGQYYLEKNHLEVRHKLFEIMSGFYSEFEIKDSGFVSFQFFQQLIKKYQDCLVTLPTEAFFSTNKKFKFIDSSYFICEPALENIRLLYDDLAVKVNQEKAS